MENKITLRQALAKLEMSAVCDDNMSVEKAEELREIIEQKFTEHEKLKEVLENIQTSKDKVKTPLSAIFEGLSQEERYTLIEHIYYSQAPWQEKYQDLQVLYRNQTHNIEMLQKENQKQKQILKNQNIVLNVLKELLKDKLTFSQSLLYVDKDPYYKISLEDTDLYFKTPQENELTREFFGITSYNTLERY